MPYQRGSLRGSSGISVKLMKYYINEYGVGRCGFRQERGGGHRKRGRRDTIVSPSPNVVLDTGSSRHGTSKL